MSFGLINAAATFSCIMRRLLDAYRKARNYYTPHKYISKLHPYGMRTDSTLAPTYTSTNWARPITVMDERVRRRHHVT